MVKLLEFVYNIVYHIGKENKVVDALSRKEGSPMIWTVYREDESGLMALSGAEWRIWDKLREAMKLDARTQEICRKLENQEDRVNGYQLRSGLLSYKNYVHVSGVLSMREKILAHFHNNKEARHLGWLRTYVRVRHFFYWEGLKKEV